MTTDRDLDRMVAEKVMGWNDSLHTYSYDRGWLDPSVLFKRGADVKFEAPIDWSPTTDPSAFIQLIEKMRELHYGVVIASGCVGTWQVRFIDRDIEHTSIAEDDVLGRAICKAALKTAEEHLASL